MNRALSTFAVCRPQSLIRNRRIRYPYSRIQAQSDIQNEKAANLRNKQHIRIFRKHYTILTHHAKFFSTLKEEHLAERNKNIAVSSAESALADHLNKVTDRLVDSKIGSLNQSSILEITTSISAWHAQAIANRAEVLSYDRSEALLCRLLDELCSEDCSVQITSQIGVDTINRVLDTWRIICNEKAPNRFKRSYLQPIDTSLVHRGLKLLRRLYAPTPHGDDFQLNDKSFNIIFDSLAKYGMTEEAIVLLEEMEDFSSNGRPQCRPDTITYNTVISGYANAINMSTSSKDKIFQANAAINTLYAMLDLYHETKSPEIKPDVISFSTVIAACANAASVSPSFAQNAEDIMDQMIEMHNASLFENNGDGEWLNILPSHICYSSVMNAWANSGVSDSVERASRIFQQMQSEGIGANEFNTATLLGAYANSESQDGIHQAEALLQKAQDSNDLNLMSTSFTYNAFINCLAHSAARALDGDGGEAATKAESVVQQMQEMYENGNQKLKPCTVTMNALINVWAKTRNFSGSGERAEYWLDKMEKDGEIKPDSTTYTTVIDAYAKNGQGQKAERMLSRMIHSAKSGNHSCIPTTFSFSSAINAYANNGKPKDAVRIMELMKEVKQNEGWNHLEIDAFCYNGIINGYLKSKQKDSIERCLELLGEMEEDGVATEVSYTSIIEGLSKVPQMPTSRDKKMIGDKVEKLLKRMWHLHDLGRKEVLPTNVTYTSVINAFSKLQWNEKAELYLNELESKYAELQDEALRPNTISYNACLSSFSRAKNEKDARRCEGILKRMQERSDGEYLRPDSFTMTNVISTWGHCGNPERAENVLNTMQSLYEQGDMTMKPTVVSFGSVINSWAQKGKVERAQAIVDHMEQLMDVEGYEEMRPNTVIYNTLINCYAKSKRPDSVTKVQDILAKMNKSKSEGHLFATPTTTTYNSVLATFLHCGGDNYGKAKDLLKKMEEVSNEDSSIELTAVTYTTFLRILANSKVTKKTLIAEGILERMEKGNLENARLRPNNFTYDATLQVCKKSASQDYRVRRHALLLAVKTLTKMQELNYIKPTSYTYAEFFSAIGALTAGDELVKLLDRTFNDCCKAGVLDNRILKIIARMLPEKTFQSLLKAESTGVSSISELPKSWSRNSRNSVSKSSERVTERSVHNSGRHKIR